MKIKKGFVLYNPSQRCWTVKFSMVKAPAGFWVGLRVSERYSRWKDAMNEYREHDRKVREYVAANS